MYIIIITTIIIIIIIITAELPVHAAPELLAPLPPVSKTPRTSSQSGLKGPYMTISLYTPTARRLQAGGGPLPCRHTAWSHLARPLAGPVRRDDGFANSRGVSLEAGVPKPSAGSSVVASLPTKRCGGRLGGDEGRWEAGKGGGEKERERENAGEAGKANNPTIQPPPTSHHLPFPSLPFPSLPPTHHPTNRN